jgi:cyclophilin family peptidyl-prolyl cis-trans isomerase
MNKTVFRAVLLAQVLTMFSLLLPAQTAKGRTARSTASTKAKGSPAASIKAKGSTVVRMETSLGPIVLQLNPDKAPISVKNFLAYVDSGFYNGTIFHRVIPTFMIQGGGFTPAMVKKTTRPPIKNEAGNGLSNKRGTIAMARTPEVDSASAQFFINVRDNSASLDHRDNSPDAYGYAVFGKVISGMDVVDKIKNVATTTKGSYQNVPVRPVTIKSVKRT